MTTAAVVVDMAGSTIVGGLVQENSWSSTTIVVKFDSSGNKLWEFRAGSGNFGGVEALAVDKLGNVFLSSRTPSEALPARVLVKLDPDGRELWHIVQKHASGNPTYASTSSVAVDDSGNVFHLGLVRRSTSDVEFCWTVAVAKYSTAGRRRWLTTLPDCDYGLPLGGIAQAMAVLPDGSLAMVGWRNGGFAAKLDASGRLLWLTSDHRSHFQPGPFSSVLVNNRGAICAGGVDGFTIFSEKGKPLHSDDSLDGVPVALTANGGYLFDQRIGPYVSAVDDKGRTQWRTHTGSLYRFGVVSNGAKGWITTGTAGWDYQLTFFHLDKHGTESWRKSFQGYAYLGRSNAWAEDRTLNSFLCAPDGTLRIVLNLAGSHGVEPGVAVAAFALEEQPQ